MKCVSYLNNMFEIENVAYIYIYIHAMVDKSNREFNNNIKFVLCNITQCPISSAPVCINM